MHLADAVVSKFTANFQKKLFASFLLVKRVTECSVLTMLVGS